MSLEMLLECIFCINKIWSLHKQKYFRLIYLRLNSHNNCDLKYLDKVYVIM